MGDKWSDEWERDSEVYSPNQIEAITNECGIEIRSETATHFLGFCPFHSNSNDPAFAIDKEQGLWTCFNPSCGVSGNLEILVRRLKGLNPFETARLIQKYKDSTATPLTERLEQIRREAPDFVPFPVEPVARLTRQFFEYDAPQEYMKGRGFEADTMRHFEVGYSVKKDMVIVPMHDPKGMLIGFVGGSIYGKDFQNTEKLPKSRTAWNYHRAKTYGETVIICESTFDAMRIHQAGYPNVIALLGGHASTFHIEQISRTFSKVIIMTDFDKRIYPKAKCRRCANIKFPAYEPVKCIGHRPGRDLGRSLAEGLVTPRIMWAAYDDSCIYPHGAKDAGDMTDDEIRQCLTGAVSNFEYEKWGIEDADLRVAS